MPTTVVKSIGTTGRDYSTLQAWEDACPADLVSDDKIWKGECYNDSEFTSGVQISGITTDSTRYAWLTVASGQSFIDHANVRTNALIYDQSKGVGIIASPFATHTIVVNTPYTRIDRLQVKRVAASYSGGLLSLDAYLNAIIKDSLFQRTFSNTAAIVTVRTNKIYNCVIVDSGGSTGGALGFFESGIGKNCTVVNASGSTNGVGISSAYSGALLQNMAVFGFTTAFSLSGESGACGYNGTDAASAPGSNNQTSLTYSDQFQSTTADFRLKSGATLIDTGNTDATNAPNDITGLVRGVGTAGDIGAWEFAASGITIPCTPGNATTAGITAGISSATTIACNAGTATTAGIACALPTTISCNVGNTTTSGIACSLPVVVQCGVGTATTAGVTAGISLDTSITIACNAGNATAAGVAAGISLDTSITISCNVGTATTAGVTAGISSATTITCNAGTATTAGVSATFPQSLSCNVGNATTTGITAQVEIAGQIVIGCNVGTATTAGIQASVSSAIVLACSAGTATTLGATAYFPQSLQCSPGNAIALGIDATFTVSGPTTIVCNVGNATASGVHCYFGSRFDTPPDAIVTVINKRNRVSVISRRS